MPSGGLIEKAEMDISQWYTAKEQQTTGTSCSRDTSKQKEELFSVGVVGHWEKFPGRLWSIGSWRYSEPTQP